jgi:hypothetical protein
LPDLAAFQRRFAAALVDPAGPHPLAGRPGFAVYRNNSAKAAIDALRAAYPTVGMLVGEGSFERLALDFFRRGPPAAPVLADYGHGFADHLEGQLQLHDLPYLSDVARIDRLRLEAHLACDADVLQPAALAGIDGAGWMKLRLKLHPAARFAWLNMPAMTIWLAHQHGEPTQALEPVWQAEGALLTRPDQAVVANEIGRAEHRLLSGLRLGETIGEAAAAVARTYPETDISRLFAKLIASGAFLDLDNKEVNHGDDR